MGPDGQPMMGPDGQPMMGPDGQPMMGPDGQPMMGPMMGPDGLPMMGPMMGPDPFSNAFEAFGLDTFPPHGEDIYSGPGEFNEGQMPPPEDFNYNDFFTVVEDSAGNRDFGFAEGIDEVPVNNDLTIDDIIQADVSSEEKLIGLAATEEFAAALDIIKRETVEVRNEETGEMEEQQVVAVDLNATINGFSADGEEVSASALIGYAAQAEGNIAEVANEFNAFSAAERATEAITIEADVFDDKTAQIVETMNLTTIPATAANGRAIEMVVPGGSTPYMDAKGDIVNGVYVTKDGQTVVTGTASLAGAAVVNEEREGRLLAGQISTAQGTAAEAVEINQKSDEITIQAAGNGANINLSRSSDEAVQIVTEGDSAISAAMASGKARKAPTATISVTDADAALAAAGGFSIRSKKHSLRSQSEQKKTAKVLNLVKKLQTKAYLQDGEDLKKETDNVLDELNNDAEIKITTYEDAASAAGESVDELVEAEQKILEAEMQADMKPEIPEILEEPVAPTPDKSGELNFVESETTFDPVKVPVSSSEPGSSQSSLDAIGTTTLFSSIKAVSEQGKQLYVEINPSGEPKSGSAIYTMTADLDTGTLLPIPQNPGANNPGVFGGVTDELIERNQEFFENTSPEEIKFEFMTPFAKIAAEMEKEMAASMPSVSVSNLKGKKSIQDMQARFRRNLSNIIIYETPAYKKKKKEIDTYLKNKPSAATLKVQKAAKDLFYKANKSKTKSASGKSGAVKVAKKAMTLPETKKAYTAQQEKAEPQNKIISPKEVVSSKRQVSFGSLQFI
jgi:hypothetical protein